VNAVCPGFVDSDMTVQSVANITAKTGRSDDEARAELARLNPSGRMITPEKLPRLCLTSSFPNETVRRWRSHESGDFRARTLPLAVRRRGGDDHGSTAPSARTR
jgi:NAD(P)-dependent dehydrogenase (short-subunit alcohol dehydrogenase family)